MCNFWSCIIDRNVKVWHDGNSSSHEDALKKSGLKDDKLEDRDFVRIEIVPKKLTMDMKDWKLKVDEDKTLPDWFRKKQEHYEKKCYAALLSYLKECNMEKVCEFIGSLKGIKWFEPDGKPKNEWEMFYGKTWDAAEAAARDAARDAAEAAARAAAEAAARAAAEAAARDAAAAAAWAAALMARILIVEDTKGFPKKHINHAKARMEVWKKGYGLYCGVNGKLYVYCKGKPSKGKVR